MTSSPESPGNSKVDGIPVKLVRTSFPTVDRLGSRSGRLSFTASLDFKEVFGLVLTRQLFLCMLSKRLT